MFQNVRADLRSARQMNAGQGWWNQHVRLLVQPGTIAVLNHRLCHWVVTLRLPVIKHLLLIPCYFIKCWAELLTGVHISPRAEIGPGLVVHTTQAIFVGPTKIGPHCVLQTGVLIASGIPSIGKNVFFGAGAKVVEGAKIGNNVVVAPNSLVLTDVPDDTSVFGVPARIRLPRLASTWFVLGHPNSNGEGVAAKIAPPTVSERL